MTRTVTLALVLTLLLLSCVHVHGQTTSTTTTTTTSTPEPSTTTTTPEPTTTTTTTTSPPIPMNADTLRFLQSIVSCIGDLGVMWRGSEYCRWEGVTCDPEGFVTVTVSARRLTGQLRDFNTKSIAGENVKVTSIDFSLNPRVGGTVPLNWYLLSQLRQVDLSGTGVTGAIPDAWGRMPLLENVAIAGTRVCGHLPNWNMPTLRQVDLRGNRLRGSLSPYWGTMSGLVAVNISGNDFCGCVPSSWSAVPALVSAAEDAGDRVLGPNCATNNRCYPQYGSCRDASMGPAGAAVLALAALLAAAAAL